MKHCAFPVPQQLLDSLPVLPNQVLSCSWKRALWRQVHCKRTLFGKYTNISEESVRFTTAPCSMSVIANSTKPFSIISCKGRLE